MKTLRILLLPLALAFAGCPAVTGAFGYTDPKTGATVGLQIGHGKASKSVKAAFRNDVKRVSLR